MTCLVHNVHYRALFHAVANELRRENRIPVPIVRNMSRKCCTCQNIDQLTLTSVLIDDKDTLRNLKTLTDQIDRDKQSNPKVVLALNRLENFIKENRGPVPPIPTPPIVVAATSNSSSDSDDDSSIDRGKRRTRKQKKPPKPVKTGTFLFLRYKLEGDPLLSVSPEAAKTVQRGRFFGRNKYIQSLEEKHHVCINMITLTTTEKIKRTLVNAKANIGNVKIHNKEDLSEEDDGEWILVRPKKKGDQIPTTNFEALLKELKDRWESFEVKKRKFESKKHTFESDSEDEIPDKKIK